MHKKIKKCFNLISIKLRQRTYNKRLHYIFEDNNSDCLLIVFPAFTGEKRRYNYIRGLKEFKSDKLFLLDDFGVKGSYLLFEGGSDIPLQLTKGLISKLLSKKAYSKVITLGSSKGGTSAIYYGLEFGADYIMAGACQYNLGSYLHREDHEDIFIGMMGEKADHKEADFLNSIMPCQLEKFKHNHTFIYNIYSENELTYQRQILDLNKKLSEVSLPHKKVVLDFDNHDDVGKHFLKYIQEELKHII